MIENLAVNYQVATTDKSCLVCYQAEDIFCEGLHCHQYDCMTQPDMRCGLFVRAPKKEDDLIVESFERMVKKLEEVLK